MEKEIQNKEQEKLRKKYEKIEKNEDHYSRLEELNKTLQVS